MGSLFFSSSDIYIHIWLQAIVCLVLPRDLWDKANRGHKVDLEAHHLKEFCPSIIEKDSKYVICPADYRSLAIMTCAILPTS